MSAGTGDPVSSLELNSPSESQLFIKTHSDENGYDLAIVQLNEV